jgi:hypothetical protein
MSSITQKQIGVAAANINVVGVNETVVAYTGRCEANLPTLRAIVRGWILFLQGTGGVGFVVRIRRGNGLVGNQINPSTTITLPAGSQLDSTQIITESLQNVEYADYTLSVSSPGASGNSTVLGGSIEVELING